MNKGREGEREGEGREEKKEKNERNLTPEFVEKQHMLASVVVQKKREKKGRKMLERGREQIDGVGK